MYQVSAGTTTDVRSSRMKYDASSSRDPVEFGGARLRYSCGPSAADLDLVLFVFLMRVIASRHEPQVQSSPTGLGR